MRRIGKRPVIGSTVILAVLLLAIQLVPVARTNPPVTSEIHAPVPVMTILRAACYDCHSNLTRWPWYSHMAPISWWLVDHVDEGRKDLNFTEWPVLDFAAQRDAMGDIAHQIEKNKMPLRSYRLGHPEARLDAQQKQTLLDWAGQGSR